MEIIYAIVKRQTLGGKNENFYIETKPYDTVAKIKKELINNFYAMEEKDMRLHLEKYDQNGQKYYIVNPTWKIQSWPFQDLGGQRDHSSGRHHKLLFNLVHKEKR